MKKLSRNETSTELFYFADTLQSCRFLTHKNWKNTTHVVHTSIYNVFRVYLRTCITSLIYVHHSNLTVILWLLIHLYHSYLCVAGLQHSGDCKWGEEQVEGGGGTAVFLPQLSELLQQRCDRRLWPWTITNSNPATSAALWQRQHRELCRHWTDTQNTFSRLSRTLHNVCI